MGSSLDDFGIGARLLGNLLHDADEVIESFAGLRFGRLDHQGLVHNQREVDGWRVHTKIEQALGDIQRGDAALFFLTSGRGDELVLARLRIGDIIVRRQFVLEVVRVEDGALGYMQQAVGAIGANVGVGAYKHAEVSLVGAYLADGLWTGILPVIALLSSGGQRSRQEGDEVFFDADGARARAPTAVRCAERLM